MRIRSFIMSASALVAVVFFAVGYFAISRILEHSVREDARQSSAATARITFASMYELMSTGWNRQQAEQFLAAIRSAARDTSTQVEIYRGPVVARDYGDIRQPPLDQALERLLAGGPATTETTGSSVRYLMPLVADGRCLRCHASATVGATLGAIEVRQDFAALIAAANRDFLLWLLAIAPLAMAMAGIVVWKVNQRLEQSIEVVDAAVTQVEAVADLRKLQFERHDLGFDELNRLFGHLGDLVAKLRSVAVDKDVLRFEIGLLEKFVITSEVVRDWGDYVSRLLEDINQVMHTPVMFSVFQVGDETLEVETFWLQPPDQDTRAMVEAEVRRMIDVDGRFIPSADVAVHHHSPAQGEPLVMDLQTFVLHTKSLMVDRPKIGGIVGIGVNSEMIEDETVRLVTDSILSTMLNVVGSVKAIHKYTRDMEYYATRDPLTDLYNRRVFWELFEYEVARASRHGYEFALLIVDLDNFKLINDNFGHAAGDVYLQAVARAMKKTLRPGDVFARYGGDEFVALLPEITSETATAVARRVLEAAAAVEQFTPDGSRIAGSVSIGLAIYPLHAQNSKDLFLFADNMMFKAKGAGKHQVGVPGEQEVAEVFRDMTATTMMVVKAINERRIVPFFQPILDIAHNRIAGYEVLSRLEQDGTQIEAARFIEYAEKAGAIHRLDTMVMEQALRKLAESGFTGHLFVNLSPRALAVADFLTVLKQTVADAGIDPAQVVFEITERDTVRNIAILERMVNELKLDGFKLAIDDFGSGFSSFQYLRRLPVDFVKIEGDFVVNIVNSERDRAFVQTIWRLAADLKIQVVAEHVEDAAVMAELQRIGVEYAQGYYVGRPGREIVA
ncbi:MAG: bifunctional diguanylate cyclase/phosphodiesterase [Rhodocyclales bacterium]|nr:bifunctional diguanylate cyclase/phosphodiesterase [Rhodocyclales bacterium]